MRNHKMFLWGSSCCRGFQCVCVCSFTPYCSVLYWTCYIIIFLSTSGHISGVHRLCKGQGQNERGTSACTRVTSERQLGWLRCPSGVTCRARMRHGSVLLWPEQPLRKHLTLAYFHLDFINTALFQGGLFLASCITAKYFCI